MSIIQNIEVNNHEDLISTLIQIESTGNPDAIGDNGKAYGILQIRQDCLVDVNKANGTEYKLDDVLGEKGVELSKWVFNEYMKIYATEKRLGRKVTDEDRARIWNGGPNGYKKSGTRGYAYRVISILNNKIS